MMQPPDLQEHAATQRGVTEEFCRSIQPPRGCFLQDDAARLGLSGPEQQGFLPEGGAGRPREGSHVLLS
jgi:hypothetical protein